MTDLASIGTILAGLGALGGAWAAWKAASTARDGLRMQIILDFAKRDAEPELGVATKMLWDFKKQSGADIHVRFASLMQENKAEWEKLDDARRKVHKYFLQLMQSKQAGLITEREIIICFYRHQLDTVMEVLEPLERVKEGYRFTKPVFQEYKRLRDNYDVLFAKYLGQAPG